MRHAPIVAVALLLAGCPDDGGGGDNGAGTGALGFDPPDISESAPSGARCDAMVDCEIEHCNAEAQAFADCYADNPDCSPDHPDVMAYTDCRNACNVTDCDVADPAACDDGDAEIVTAAEFAHALCLREDVFDNCNPAACDSL